MNKCLIIDVQRNVMQTIMFNHERARPFLIFLPFNMSCKRLTFSHEYTCTLGLFSRANDKMFIIYLPIDFYIQGQLWENKVMAMFFNSTSIYPRT